MEHKKYWWYTIYNTKGNYYMEEVTDRHPFRVYHDVVFGGQVLHNWKEITEEEYNLFNSLNSK